MSHMRGMMVRRSRKALVSIASAMGALAAATALFEGDARACGGCFAPPSETPTIVTDHRMILSVSKEQTTLYDQIRYQGAPASFAWVLPISGTVEVGLSADVVFGALDGLTQTRILAPPQNCPPRPSDCNSFGGLASAENAGAPSDAVTVTKREVVGPYETVQLHSQDPAALDAWLATNGFAIPSEIKPVITQYVAEHFDFLALKLVPGKSVQDMRPVRVTTKGASAVLPLRMIAAGAGPVVGVSLWVVAEGRYEPQNFPSFYIKTEDIAWDWSQSRSTYVDLRAAQTTASGGRGWETESSLYVVQPQITSQVAYGTSGSGSWSSDPAYQETLAQEDYLPVKDANGNVTKTSLQVRQEDMTTLFFGIPMSATRITRLRADIRRAGLDRDLLLGASPEQGVLSNVRQLTKELNEPQCPVWDGCDSDGTAPRSVALARSSSGSGAFACAATGSSPTAAGAAWLGAGAAAIALASAKLARRRRAARGQAPSDARDERSGAS